VHSIGRALDGEQLDCPIAGQVLAASETPLSVSLETDAGALEKDWRRLERLPGSSPHQGYDWCKAWAKAQSRDLLLVVARQETRVVMILPLDVVTRHGVRLASFPGGRFNNINTGLFDEHLQLSPEAQQDLARQIRACLAGRTDLVVLDVLPQQWAGRPHPLGNLPQIQHPNPSLQLPLIGGFEATLAQLNAKRRRKKYRVQVRRIDEAGGFEHYIPQTAPERHALLDLFFEQKRIRFEAHGLPDAFADPAIQAFFHSLLDMPQRGKSHPLVLHAIRLKAGGEGSIAAISGLSYLGDQVICQFGSIDESRVPDASPGELLFWLMIEKACADGFRIFNFGIGDQPYKRSWCPVVTQHLDILLPVSLKGRIAMLGHSTLSGAKSLIKRNPAIYRQIQRLRAAASGASKHDRPQPEPAGGDD
jgi:CelD/BcsL family acetyltransferase involved in cellulose biosynthesis